MTEKQVMPNPRLRAVRRQATNCAPARSPTPLFPTRVRLLPIVFFLSYLISTILLFGFGPWKYPVADPFRLYLFLALAHLALLAGYLSGAFGSPRSYRGRWTAKQLVLWSGIATVALLLPTSRFRTGFWFPDVASGLADPARAYGASQFVRQIAEPIVEYVRVLLGPVLILLLPLTVFYWPRIGWKLRALGAAGIAGTVAIFIAMGTNNEIVDTILLVPLLLVAAHLGGIYASDWRKVVAAVMAAACVLALFLVYFFGVGVSARTGSPLAADVFPAASASADYQAVEHGDRTLIDLDLYLTSGYYALDLCLRVPFVPMYGLGNSMFLTRQAARISGDPGLEDMTYPARIERYGWSAQGLWSSIYPWIASDVSFPGTIVVVFLIGRLFALSWLDTLNAENPFAVALFAQFAIMLFYFPANNQLLQSGEGFTAFWATLFLWWRTRTRPSRTPPGRRAYSFPRTSLRDHASAATP